MQTSACSARRAKRRSAALPDRSPARAQGAAGAAGAGAGHTGHTAADRSSAGKGEQKPEGTSQAAPAQPHSQAQAGAAAPSACAQRPLGPQSSGQPRVAWATSWPEKTYSDLPSMGLPATLVL